MVDLETEWKPSRKLNAIAGALDFTVVDPLPDDVTRDQIEEYCYTLGQIYGDYVDELVAETALSRREAQTWVLRNLVHGDSERLSYEAVGLYIWAIGRATEGDPLSRTIVSEYHERADRKISRAEETVKRTGPPPYPDDLYDEPALLWVEERVGDRLGRRLDADETYSDLLERLLDETATVLSVTDLVEAYRETHGSEYVAVETVRPDWDRHLRVLVGASRAADRPAAVADADLLTVGGRTYEFTVEEQSDPRHGASHLPLFSTGADGKPVAPEDGVERLAAVLGTVELGLPELVDRARESGVTALAVDEEPAAAGAHLYPVGPDGADGPPEVFDYVERVALDDRTLTVGRVTPVAPDEYDEVADGSVLLWAAEDGSVEARALPDDPVERRERFPAPVLRTA